MSYLSGCIRKSEFRLQQSQKDRIPWKQSYKAKSGREATGREGEKDQAETGRLGNNEYIKNERTGE